MVETIVMPKLGFNMSEGKLVCWYKKEGEEIRKGEPLFSIETDKTAIDVESTRDGVVRSLLVREEETVPVTLPIAIISDAGEDFEAERKAALGRLSGVNAEAPAESKKDSPAALPSAPSDEGRFDYDVIVVGGGPGGYVAAIKAAQLGKRVALVEKDRTGGVCLNRGCIPTKILLRSAEALKEVQECGRYAVSGVDASRASLDMAKLQNRKNEIIGQLVGGVDGLLKKNGVTRISGVGNIADANTVTAGGKSYKAAYIIIATGSSIKNLPIPTDGGAKVLTSDDLLSMTELPREIVVIGGGVIGVELAYFLVSAGVKVTIIEFLDRILPMIDAEIAGLAAKKLERMGVVMNVGSRVTKIAGKAVFFETGGGEHKAEADCVLMAVGRGADTGGIDCEALGIKLDRGAIITDASLRTSVPNIFAIGDVNGKAMLAHTASMEGIVAAEVISGHASVMNYDRIPNAVYLQPELASVGLTEEQAREKYPSAAVGRFPLMANGKSKLAGEDEGLAKVIVDTEYGEILGVHLWCLHATDIISEATAAMCLEATAEELAMTVHPHPSIAEALQEAVHAAMGKPIHFFA